MFSRWTIYGTHTQPLAGFAASDRDVTITGMTVAMFDGAKVVAPGVLLGARRSCSGKLESFRR